MAKNIEKSKVGRPKLADQELIKDSWYKVAACLSIALVLAICCVGVLTARTPWQVITFQNAKDLSGLVAKAQDPNVRIISVDSLNNERVVEPKASEKRIISVDGTVTRIIPVN